MSNHRKKTEAPKPRRRLSAAWLEMAKVLEIPQAKNEAAVIDHAQWLIESYRSMCDRLQTSVQKHKLGLGGENIATLVCEALDEAFRK